MLGKATLIHRCIHPIHSCISPIAQCELFNNPDRLHIATRLPSSALAFTVSGDTGDREDRGGDGEGGNRECGEDDLKVVYVVRNLTTNSDYHKLATDPGNCQL